MANIVDNNTLEVLNTPFKHEEVKELVLQTVVHPTHSLPKWTRQYTLRLSPFFYLPRNITKTLEPLLLSFGEEMIL